MWLKLKLKLTQTEDGYSPEHSKGGKWVVVQLRVGYVAETFPPAEGQKVSENFYKFISSLPSDPVGTYRIIENETKIPDDLYRIGPTAPPSLKVWKYESSNQRLFFQTISTFTGTTGTQNKNTVEADADVVLNNVMANANGFVLNASSGGYGNGEVLRISPERKPFTTKGKIYWESGQVFE